MDQHGVTQPAPTYSQANGIDNHGAINNDKQQYAMTQDPQQPQIQMQGQLPPQGQPQQQQFIVARPGANYETATPLASLQKFPAPVDCPVCRVREMTIVNEETGGYTHAMAAIACFCCCLGCIPYMMSSFKNVLHKCGSCGAPLALWHRSGSTEVLQHR